MAEQVDLKDLARRLEALERRFDGVADAARQRQDDWGSIQAQAAKVPDLLEEIRQLTRSVARLARKKPAEVTPPAAETKLPADLSKLAELVLSRLQAQLPTSEQISAQLKELVLQAVTDAVRKLDLTGLAERAYGDISTTTIEEKLAKLLRDRVGAEVDTKVVVQAMADRLWKELDVDALLKKISEAVAATVADRLEISLKRRF